LHVSHTEAVADAGRRSVPPHATPAPDDDFEREIDLAPYVAPLLRRWPLLLALTVLGAVVGFVISGRRPIVYEASTTVLVQQAESAAAFSTARALLRNHTLAAETVTELGLTGEPYNLTPQRFVDGALAVDEIGGTHLLHVKVRLPDAALAAKASHALSSKAVELNRRVRTEGTTAVRDQLKAVLDDAAVDLRISEKELLAARTRTQLDVLKKDAEVMLESRATYQQLLIDIEGEKARLAAAEAEMPLHDPVLAGRRSPAAEEALRRAIGVPAAVGDPRRGSSPPAVEAPPRRPTPDMVEAADPQLLDLSQPNVNPVHQTLAFQIATSRTLLANMERRRRELAALHGAGASQLKPLNDLYRGEIEMARLEDRYEQARRTYKDLAARHEQSRTDAIGRTALLQIVDPAIPPEQPVSRRRGASLIAGALAGLLIAATLALALGRQSTAYPAALPGRAAASNGS
jgi:uncharacterized protein involved in exopolysaccharide biosynthesis